MKHHSTKSLRSWLRVVTLIAALVVQMVVVSPAAAGNPSISTTGGTGTYANGKITLTLRLTPTSPLSFDTLQYYITLAGTVINTSKFVYQSATTVPNTVYDRTVSLVYNVTGAGLASSFDVAYSALSLTGNTVYLTLTYDDGNDNNGGDNTPPPPATPATEPSTIKAPVTTVSEVVDGKTEVTVVIDDAAVQKSIDAAGTGSTVSIPVVGGDADVEVAQINGETFEHMEDKEAVVEIKTENVTYTLPAAELNIDSVVEQMGGGVTAADIKVEIKIAAPPADTAKIVEDTANKNSYQIVVQPIDFAITCTAGSKTVEVSRFNAYVERTVAIPDGVDPSKITTGIVLNNDGTFSHVPTKIVIIGGKYYAKINSLTNSTYSVIFSPKTFADVNGHWAMADVNDMGSRLIISGVTTDSFAPERDITRAEFAAIMVRALGLMRTGTGKVTFSDVVATDWYYDAVSIAAERKIVDGMGDGTFRPMDKITRQQAMAMIARGLSVAGVKSTLTSEQVSSTLAQFPDASSVSAWARQSAATCISNNVVTGSDGKLLALVNISRAQSAAMVRRMLKKAALI